jgi:hypothetical protein
LLGRSLVTHRADGGHIRADELHAQTGQGFRKSVALAKVAVARVHGIGAGGFHGRQHVGQVQIAVGVGRFAHADGFICQQHMAAGGIGLAVDGHALDAHFTAGPNHAAGDFAPVGNQDLLEHQ